MKNNELPFNKTNFINLKKERDMLKITLQYITQENENLKNELNDMKITAKKNKDMLKEYVYQITNKDKLFEKMTSTIEQLKSRLKAMEQLKKDKKKYEKEISNDLFNYNNYNYTTNNRSTTTNSNNYTSNNIIATTGGETNSSFGFNILNNNIKKNKIIMPLIDKNNNKTTSNIILGNKGFNILNKNYKENIKNIIATKKEISPNKNIEDKNDIKYFLEKQKNIMEEIDNIKDDIQFLMENRSKSKMREKLNQSIAYNNSLNSSFCSEQKNNENNNISFTSEKSLENSYLSNLSVTYNGPDPTILRQLNYNLNISQQNNNNNIDLLNIKNETNNNKNKNKKKNNNYNLKDNYLINENFSLFINKINMKKDILFLIDGKNNVWELVKRGDLTKEQIEKYENEKEKDNRIKSVLNLCDNKNNNLIDKINKNENNKNYLEKEVIDENLLDIKIKEPTDFLFK